MLASTAAAVVLAGWRMTTTGMRERDALLAAVIAGCAGLCLEAARRQGLPGGVTRDLLTVWCLPVALLLPRFTRSACRRWPWACTW